MYLEKIEKIGENYEVTFRKSESEIRVITYQKSEIKRIFSLIKQALLLNEDL